MRVAVFLAQLMGLALALPPKSLLPFGLPKPSRGLTTGDLKIAFLAPLRYMNKETGRCEEVCDKGLDLAEVAVFAAKRANEEILNGTGVSIGLQIMDSCPGMAKILTNLMLPMAEEAECPLSKIQFRPTSRAATTIGIVGLDDSNEIQEYRDFAMHFNIPAISYRAASTALEEKDKLPFLFRSTPCDSKLYAAMARQINTMAPSALGVVVEDSEYGRRGKDVIARQLTEKGILNVRYEMIPANPDNEDIVRAVSNLVGVPGASLLAFVVSDETTPVVMEGLSIMDASLLRPIIGPGGFGNYLNISNAKRFENMVVVRHTLNPMPGFEGYYRGLCEKGGNTPWWHEKWETYDKVQLSARRLQCHQTVPDKPEFHFAANAIYSLAHALRRFVVTSCSAAEKSACAQCHQTVPDKPEFHFAANAIYSLAHALRRFVVTSCSAAEKSDCAQCHQTVPDKPEFHFAANAIYSLAHALRRFVVTSCSAAEKSACAQYLEQCWARESIMGHLRTVNFQPLGADANQRFTFDRSQDVEPNYEMVQLKVRSSIVQWDSTL